MAKSSNRRIALICHWPEDRPYWLQEALRERSLSVSRFSRPWGRRRRRWYSLADRFGTMLLGWRVAHFAAKHDAAIVADSDGHMAGVFAAISLPPLGRPRPPILCINLLLYDKPGLRTYLRKLVYRLALRNPRITFTVSTPELQRHYAEILRTVPERFVVLPDCYAPHHLALARHDPMHDGGYVFVGGDAARDWDTAILAARLCSSIPFVFVAFSRSWPGTALPPNVELRLDVPLMDFHETMRRSRLAVVPLHNGVVTAGIIVVTQAGLKGCPVIATSTPATRLYYPLECEDLLVPMGDDVVLAERIQHFWDDANACRLTTRHLRAFVIEHHSPEAYASRIDALTRAARDH